MVEDDYEIGLADGAETVGDDEARAPVGKIGHGTLEHGLGVGVDAACSLVENEDWRTAMHGAGDGEQLPLPVGEGGIGAYALVVRIG